MEKRKIIKRTAVICLAIVIVVAFTLCVFTKGFTDWRFGKEPPAVNDLNNNVVVTPQKGNGGIRLMAEFQPEITGSGDDADYEGATLTITATVSPDNSADNTGLDWSMTFKNPSSAWATGKTLSDYMTLTPSGTDAAGSKTVSVKCLKPFGEQVVITATSQDNPEVTASCTADFAQRIESAALKFGDLNVNLGGDTNVKWELNPNGAGVGGATNVTTEKSDVYTLAEDFTYTVTAESSFFRQGGSLPPLGRHAAFLGHPAFIGHVPVAAPKHQPQKKHPDSIKHYKSNCHAMPEEWIRPHKVLYHPHN